MQASAIVENIERYHRLERHSDPQLNAWIVELEQWKAGRMLYAYRPIMQEATVEELLNYYLDEVFCGIDLSEFKSAKRAIGIIQKFFTGTDMLASALEFNALTGEMNQQLARLLFADGNADLNEERYIWACHEAGVVDDLFRQMELFYIFADDLNKTVADKRVVATIKLATMPAKLGGFKKIHKLAADGLSKLRAVDDPETLAQSLILGERRIAERVASKTLPLYRPITEA